MFQCNQLRAFRLLRLQLGNLIVDPCFVISTGLDALLGVPNCLQNCSAVIQIVRVEILLFAKLGE